MSAKVGPARASAHRPAPSQSGRRPTRLAARAGIRAAIATETRMNGRLIAKIHRQLRASTSQPPTRGPTTAATPLYAVQVPIAFPRSFRGKAATIIASDAGDRRVEQDDERAERRCRERQALVPRAHRTGLRASIVRRCAL